MSDIVDIAEGDVVEFFNQTQAFTWRFQQDVFTYLKQLHDKGISLDYAMRCINYRKQMQMQNIKLYQGVKELWEKNSLRCPDCGKVMSLEHINTVPGNQIPGGWKSIWRCTDFIDCGFEELSKKSVAQWVKKLNLVYAKVGQGKIVAVPTEVLDEAPEVASMAPPKLEEKRNDQHTSTGLRAGRQIDPYEPADEQKQRGLGGSGGNRQHQ